MKKRMLILACIVTSHMKKVISIIIVLVISISFGQSQSVIKKNKIWQDVKSVILWDSTIPFPKLENIPRIPNIEYSLVHAQNKSPEWKHLHEPRIAWHKGVLFVSFSHAGVFEADETQRMNGKRSSDGGRTWSNLETIASGKSGHWRTETAALLSAQGKLWGFTGRYGGGKNYGKNSFGMEIHQLDTNTDKFTPLSSDVVLESFVPFVQPQRMKNGNWIIGGHINKVQHSAVAISKGNDLTQWHAVKIETPQPSEFPETSILTQGKYVVAIIRQAKEPELKEHRLTALAAVSKNSGETFSPALSTNLPMINSKPFSGTLSTGQHYVIFSPSEGAWRNTLLIGVTNPGELLPLRRVWKLIEGTPFEIKDQLISLGQPNETHQWAYPEAIEIKGTLYVTFSQDKRNCWIARIPIGELNKK